MSEAWQRERAGDGASLTGEERWVIRLHLLDWPLQRKTLRAEGVLGESPLPPTGRHLSPPTTPPQRWTWPQMANFVNAGDKADRGLGVSPGEHSLLGSLDTHTVTEE